MEHGETTANKEGKAGCAYLLPLQRGAVTADTAATAKGLPANTKLVRSLPSMLLFQAEEGEERSDITYCPCKGSSDC